MHGSWCHPCVLSIQIHGIFSLGDKNIELIHTCVVLCVLLFTLSHLPRLDLWLHREDGEVSVTINGETVPLKVLEWDQRVTVSSGPLALETYHDLVGLCAEPSR
jgi:hypothetical protein